MKELVIIIIIIINIMLIWIMKQDWLSPASINIYWNSFFIIFSVMICGKSLGWNYGGVIWILISMLLFLIGQKIGGKIGGFSQNDSINIAYISNIAYIILAILTILGMLLPIMYIKSYNYSIKDIFQINKLLEINTTIARDRYITQEVSLGIIGIGLVIITYFIALCGGYLFIYADNFKLKLICIIVLLPHIGNMLVTNTKSGLISVAFLWISGFIVSYLKYNRNTNIISVKTSMQIIIICMGAMILFDLAMMMRLGEISIVTQEIVFKKLQIYIFGQVHSFDYWYANMIENPYDLGVNTFMFFTNWLGLTVRSQGVYEFIEGATSNVFTQNRGIIVDFGKIGGLLYWFIFGGVSGFLYKRVKNMKLTCIGSQILLCSIYFSILYGFIISPWVYSSYVIAFTIFWLALFLIKNVKVSIRG